MPGARADTKVDADDSLTVTSFVSEADAASATARSLGKRPPANEPSQEDQAAAAAAKIDQDYEPVMRSLVEDASTPSHVLDVATSKSLERRDRKTQKALLEHEGMSVYGLQRMAMGGRSTQIRAKANYLTRQRLQQARDNRDSFDRETSRARRDHRDQNISAGGVVDAVFSGVFGGS